MAYIAYITITYIIIVGEVAKLHDETVLITGASRGIGRAIACAFADAGYQVVINCIKSEDALLDLKRRLEARCRVPVLASVGDVSEPSYVQRLFDEARERFGGVDILINNAGISYFGLLQDMRLEDWNRVLAANLTSVFLTCRLAIPHMLRSQAGRILNISSVFGSVGGSCEVAYSACKGGVNAFTKALAKELAPSMIQVNAIACGAIDTQMNGRLSEGERKSLEGDIPAGRFGTPEEVADLALRITTGSSYLTGQVITIDGGWT